LKTGDKCFEVLPCDEKTSSGNFSSVKNFKKYVKVSAWNNLECFVMLKTLEEMDNQFPLKNL
jgi:hypothetical protein